MNSPLKAKVRFSIDESINRHADIYGFLHIRKRWCFCSSWKRRYFVLRNEKLMCYESMQATEPLRTYDLSLYTTLTTNPNHRSSPLAFELSAAKNDDLTPDIALEAPDTHAYCSWLDVLSQFLQDSGVTRGKSFSFSAKPSELHSTPMAELQSDPISSELGHPSRLLLASRSVSTSRPRRFSLSFKKS